MSRHFWTIFGVWTAYGGFNTVVVHSRSVLYGKPMSWTSTALAEVSYPWIWAALTPLVLLLGRRFPVGRGHSWPNILVHLVGALLVSIISKVVWDLSVLPLVQPEYVPVNFWTFVTSVIRTIDFGVLHYGIIIVVQHAIEYYRRYEDGRLRASQLEARLATAQLQALKMQLHPHFLFNTLHSIAELVHDKPGHAESMIVRLSDFLRLTLDQVGAAEVPLSEEIDFLHRYLDIEQMRFEDRLTVEWEIDNDVLDARVPNLILQPIVENALKHGISRNVGAGVLRILCRAEEGRLLMQVVDNGPGPVQYSGVQSGPVREGVGLNNTRNRLAHLYGGDHRIDMHRGLDGGFVVTLRIPLRLSSHRAAIARHEPEPTPAGGD